MNQAEVNERAAIVRGAVAQLPPKQRAVVTLWAQGYSHREIAERVGCAEVTSRAHLRDAKKNLRGGLHEIAS